MLTGIDVVDNDVYIKKLNNEIQDLYSSYYKINYNNHLVYFDKEQDKKDKYKMLDLLGKLMKRLDEVNDGYFEVDDRETERVITYKLELDINVNLGNMKQARHWNMVRAK